MNATNKAPAGGMTSVVNGSFYNGGEFMPDHGKFCGKGKNSVTKADFDSVAELAKRGDRELVFNATTGLFVVKYPGGNIMMSAKSLRAIEKSLKFLYG